MSERFRGPIRTFRRNAPAIETGLGVAGIVGMAGVAIDPQKAREASAPSPIGVDAVAKRGEELGLPDQATFAIITVIFGAFAMHGVWRLRRRGRQRNP